MPDRYVGGVTRRTLLVRAGLAGAGATLLLPRLPLAAEPPSPPVETAGLAPMTAGVLPISAVEREGRLARAQALMQAAGITALLVESGSSLVYFTGVRWGRSERLTAALVPARGRVVLVTPRFEEPSVRESLDVDAEVRVWQEDEDPLAIVAGALRDRGAAAGPIGIEETVRYFAVDGLARNLPHAVIVNGSPVVRGCRMIKSAHEIALMQIATDITIAAYRFTGRHVREEQTPQDIARIMNAATVALGGAPEFALVLLGEASAYPHGSAKPQRVREGEMVLMDCGCAVEGYQSDVSRTFVPGAPTAHQRAVWDDVHAGQQTAFAAARIGAPAGSVDDAVRTLYARLGYGPGYRLPGLSHRTGHGIGLDGHEPVNFVHDEHTRLAAGMCFSDEPGLYIPGAFGVRLEDCIHMTPAGARWFSEPPPSIDRPFG